MPRIKEYKITTETLGGSAYDESYAMPAHRVDSFIEGLDEGFSFRRGGPDVLDWHPSFPAGLPRYSMQLTEQALYEANWYAILEQFENAGLSESIETDSGEGSLLILADDKRALALAAYLEMVCENYPVLDDDRLSERELELTREAYNDYGREELIDAIEDMMPALGFILDEDEYDCADTGGIAPEWFDIVEPYLFDMARDAVAYSGELYFGTSNMQNVIPDPDALALELKAVKAQKDEEVFETTQPKLEGIEVPERVGLPLY